MEVQKFLMLVKETFDAHCEKVMYTPKFYLPDHDLEGMEWFGSLDFLNGSAFERFNVLIK